MQRLYVTNKYMYWYRSMIKILRPCTSWRDSPSQVHWHTWEFNFLRSCVTNPFLWTKPMIIISPQTCWYISSHSKHWLQIRRKCTGFDSQLGHETPRAPQSQPQGTFSSAFKYLQKVAFFSRTAFCKLSPKNHKVISHFTHVLELPFIFFELYAKDYQMNCTLSVSFKIYI